MKTALVACLAGSMMLGIQPTMAAIQVSTDLTSFNAAVPSASIVEDFASFSPKNTNLGLIDTSVVSITPAVGSQIVVSEGNPFFDVGIPVGAVVTGSVNDTFTVALKVPTLGVGFDTYLNAIDDSGLPENPEATVEVFGANGLLGMYTHTHSNTEVGFLGILADEPIYSFLWISTGGKIRNTGIGNIRQGGMTVVPEAASLFSFLLVAAVLATQGIRSTARGRTESA